MSLRGVFFRQGGIFRIAACNTLVYVERVVDGDVGSACVVALPDQPADRDPKHLPHLVPGLTRCKNVSPLMDAAAVPVEELSETNRTFVENLAQLRAAARAAQTGHEVPLATPAPAALSTPVAPTRIAPPKPRPAKPARVSPDDRIVAANDRLAEAELSKGLESLTATILLAAPERRLTVAGVASALKKHPDYSSKFPASQVARHFTGQLVKKGLAAYDGAVDPQ